MHKLYTSLSNLTKPLQKEQPQPNDRLYYIFQCISQKLFQENKSFSVHSFLAHAVLMGSCQCNLHQNKIGWSIRLSVVMERMATLRLNLFGLYFYAYLSSSQYIYNLIRINQYACESVTFWFYPGYTLIMQPSMMPDQHLPGFVIV